MTSIQSLASAGSPAYTPSPVTREILLEGESLKVGVVDVLLIIERSSQNITFANLPPYRYRIEGLC